MLSNEILEEDCIVSILTTKQKHEEDVEIQKVGCLALKEVDCPAGNHRSIFISANGKKTTRNAIVFHKDVDEIEN